MSLSTFSVLYVFAPKRLNLQMIFEECLGSNLHKVRTRYNYSLDERQTLQYFVPSHPPNFMKQ